MDIPYYVRVGQKQINLKTQYAAEIKNSVYLLQNFNYLYYNYVYYFNLHSFWLNLRKIFLIS